MADKEATPAVADNAFGINLDAEGGSEAPGYWEPLGGGNGSGTPARPGRFSRGWEALKNAASGIHKPNIKRPEVHMPDIHLPKVPKPDIHMPNVSVPRPDFSRVGNALGGTKDAVGGVMGVAGERIGHVVEVFKTAHVREAISHAVTDMTSRVPRPEFVGAVARRSVKELANQEFLGQSLLDWSAGFAVGAAAKTAARVALGISGVGAAEMFVIGMVGGAATAGLKESFHQRRELSRSADEATRDALRTEFKKKHRLRNAIIRGAMFGGAGAVVGGEIAGAILDRVGVVEVGMPSLPSFELPNIQASDLSGANQAIGGVKDAAGGALGGGLGAAGEAIGRVAGGIGGGVGGALGGAGEAIGGVAGGAGEVTKNVPVLGGTRDLLGNAGKTVGNTLGNAGNFIGENNPFAGHAAPQLDLDKIQEMQAVDNQLAGHAAPQLDLDKIQEMQAVDNQQAAADVAEARERAEEARRAAQPEAPATIPPTDVYGHTMAGSVIEHNLTWDGQPWALLENGVKNIGNVFEATGQSLDPGIINQELLAQKLQEAAILQAQGQLTYAANPDLYDLFHLCNGTASEYPGLLNTDTLDVLKSLNIVGK